MNYVSAVGFRRLGLFIRAAMIGLVAGCGAAQPQSVAQPPTPTSVQLSWTHTIEFVGFYEAIRQNYYKDAGLDVRLDPGGFDASGAYIDPVAQVLAGKADFGVTGADVILKARSAGQA